MIKKITWNSSLLLGSLALLGGCSSSSPGPGGENCVPKTCEQLTANCGTQPDGCGNLISCGSCIEGQTCGAAGPNQCGTGTCTPQTCTSLGLSCGSASDTCGGIIECGDCGTEIPGTGSGGQPGTPGGSGGGGTDPDWKPGELTGFYPTTVTTTEVKGYYDAWKSKWVASCPSGSLRVKWDDANKTVSEGIGYGMLLAASWDDQTTLDGMWKYYNEHKNARGLMGWIGTCSSTEDQGAASDADLDVAMALLMAHCKWPSAGYDTAATAVIGAMKTHLLKNDGGRWFLCAGDNWGNDCCGNASYQAPAYYRAFGLHTGDTAYWNKAAEDSYHYLLTKMNQTTGLVSDWMVPNQLQCSAKGEGDFHGWDASRVPWRIATDYAWWGISDAKSYSEKISSFVDGKGGIHGTAPGHHLDGRDYGGDAVATFAGAFASSGIAINQSTVDTYFNDLKTVNYDGYFNEILRTLYFTLAVKQFGYCGTE